MRTLTELIQDHLPEGGVIVPGGQDLHMEVIDTATNMVWMSYDVVTQKDFDDLELGDGLQRVGIAAASMDAALFKHSPNGEGEAVMERTIGGHRFINVATPLKTTPLPGGMTELMVGKAHVLGYNAGRKVSVLSTPEGDFVELVGDNEFDDQLLLPEGFSIKQIELAAPWVVELPNPTKTIWQFGESMRSFQGPVALPH